MSQTTEAPACAECGFSVESSEHQRGIGLHGHQSTTKKEADEQRADVFARAQAFSDSLNAPVGKQPKQPTKEEAIAAAIDLLTAEGLLSPNTPEPEPTKASRKA